MSDPTADLRSASLALEARLLRSASLDVPSPEGKRRTLAALGAAAGVTTAVGAAAVAGRLGVATKWLAIGSVSVAVATSGAVEWARRSNAEVAAQSPLANRPASPIPSGVRSPSVDEAPFLAPAVPTLPADSSPAAAGGRPSPRTAGEVRAAHGITTPSGASRAGDLPVPSTDDSRTLLAEVAAIDDARQALARSDGKGALRELDAYEHRFTRRKLEAEATVLRIEALSSLGDDTEARRLGEGFLAGDPSSAYAQRVRSVLGAASPAGSNR
jgi:hypothetical protein